MGGGDDILIVVPSGMDVRTHIISLNVGGIG